MRKIKRILILLSVILIIFSFYNLAFAAQHAVPVGGGSGRSGGDATDSSSIAGQFGGKDVTNTDEGGKIKYILSIALELVRNIGIGVAIIMLIVLGSKYMIASAGEKAEIKKGMGIYVIGAVVLISASGIIGIIQKFVTEVTE